MRKSHAPWLNGVLTSGDSMRNFVIILFSLTMTGCLTLNEQQVMRDDIGRLQAKVLEVEQNMAAEKASGGAAKQLASSNANIDRLSQQQSKMAGEIDGLRRALERGEMPGSEHQKDSIFAKMENLELRMAELEQAQREIIELLEKSNIKLASSGSDPIGNQQVSEGKTNKEVEPKLNVDPKATGSKGIKEARVLFTKNKWKQIIEMAPQALASLEKNAEKEEFFSLYAESLFKSGDIKESAIKYNEFLEMKPSKKHLAQAKMRMGDCYRHLGDADTALIYYQEVVRDFPKTEQGIKSKERISQLSDKKKQKAVR